MSISDQVGIRNLKVFQSLMKELSVSRAAEQVGLTQQAVSVQLKKLREVFGDPLFVRTPSGLLPTPAAERLYAQVDKVISELDGLKFGADFDPAKASGTFTIAATDYAQIIVLPHLLDRLRQEAPNLKIDIRDIDRNRCQELLQAGLIDLLITIPEFIPETLPRTTLFKEQYLCVTSKGNSINKEKMSIEKLAAHPQISVSPSRPISRESIDLWFNEQGHTRNVVVSAPCFSLVPEYIRRMDAIAFLPARAFDASTLAVLDIDNLPDGFDVVAAWHMRTNNEPLHKWMLGLLESSAVEVGE